MGERINEVTVRAHQCILLAWVSELRQMHLSDTQGENDQLRLRGALHEMVCSEDATSPVTCSE